jgi:hypothetical protein
MKKLLTTSIILSSILTYDLHASAQPNNDDNGSPLKVSIVENNNVEPTIDELMKGLQKSYSIDLSTCKRNRSHKPKISNYRETRLRRFGPEVVIVRRSKKSLDIINNE